jgi:hypothetical protein
VLLCAGNLIRFDEGSGLGSLVAVLVLGCLAALAAVASVVVAWPDPTVRRRLGIAMLALDVFLVWASHVHAVRRFVRAADIEGYPFVLQVVLGITALVLMTRPAGAHSGSEGVRTRPIMTGPARALAYLAASLFVVLRAFFLGDTFYGATECSGPDFTGECDLGGLAGMVCAAAAIPVMVVVVILLEVLVRRRSRVLSRR